ncbi:MAG: GumC family protein [Candidatus Melainabacteria bacterium]
MVNRANGLLGEAFPVQPESMGSAFSLRRLARLARENVTTLVIIAIVVMGWVTAYVLLMYQPSYESSASVIIKDSAITKRYVESEQYYSLKTTTSSNSSPVLNTMKLLYSSPISESLYLFFKTKYPEELRKRNVDDLEGWQEFYKDGSDFLSSKNIPGTDIITIGFVWTDAKIARAALKHVVSSFKAASLSVNRAEQEDRAKYLQGKTADLRVRLDAVRTTLSGYQQNMHVVNSDEESLNLSSSRLTLKNQIAQLNAQLQGKMAEKERYEKMLGVTPDKAILATSIGLNSQLTDLQKRLYEKKQKYAELISYYTEQAPQVKQVQSEIRQIESNIDSELRRTLGDRYTPDARDLLSVTDSNRANLIQNMVTAEAEVSNLKNQVSTLQGRLGQLEGDIYRIPETSQNITRLQEEEASLSKALDTMRERTIEANLQEAQTLSNVFIVDEPTEPFKARFPRQIHLFLMGIAGTFMIWFAMILLKARLEPVPVLTVVSPSDSPTITGLQPVSVRPPAEAKVPD